jgi:hypothetical protein
MTFRPRIGDRRIAPGTQRDQGGAQSALTFSWLRLAILATANMESQTRARGGRVAAGRIGRRTAGERPIAFAA